MNPSLKKVLSGLHFPVFLILLVYFSLEFILIPDDWVGNVSALGISAPEKETVLFLSRFMFIQIFQNFLISGILFFLFTIISMNPKRFIINLIVLYFFINFFFFYFSQKFAPGLLDLYISQFFLSILSTCILFVIWSVVPYLIMKKIRARRAKNNVLSLATRPEPINCKNCGEQYLSNPIYCAKCHSKLDS